MYDHQIEHVERMPAVPAQYGTLREPLHPRVWAALGALGIKDGGLFEHQVDAISTLLRGENVTVCTATASGKSLCYLVPIIQVRTWCLLFLMLSDVESLQSIVVELCPQQSL